MRQRAMSNLGTQDNNYSNQVINKLTYKEQLKETIKVISLFSGCGGLDLGFEGGFDVPKACITDFDFIDSEKSGNVILKKTPFEIVFCNDRLKS